jgi:hypothetical protein
VPYWGKPIGIGGKALVDPGFLDQGKQTKPVHVPERSRPQSHRHPQGIYSSKGVMEVRNGGDVPGATGQGACEEATLVIDEMGDYHFNDFLGEPGRSGRVYRGNLWGNTTGTRSPDSG